MRPLAERLQVFCVWATLAGIFWISIYPTTNYLAGLRSHTYRWFVPLELGVPFVPGWIGFYLSMYLLFPLPPFFLDPPALRRLGVQLIEGTLLSGLIFVVFPTTLGFERVLPADPTLAAIYARVFELDHPHNLVPSMHVVWTGLIALAVRDGARGALRWLLLGWLICVALSTVLVHQHHLLDVVAALALVAFLRSSGRAPRAEGR